MYQCLKCNKPFDEVVTIFYTEYAGACQQQEFVSPCCRSMRYEEIEIQPSSLGWIACYCGNRVSLEPRGQYDYFCPSCGQRFNGAGQTLRKYCCLLDEQGIDCGHDEIE